jgi:hypothetical protein
MEPTSAADLALEPHEAEAVRTYRKMSPMWKSVIDTLPSMDEERREQMLRLVWEQMLKVGGVNPLPPGKPAETRKRKK